MLADRGVPYSKIARSFHAHPFFRGYSANFWRQLKYEIHTDTVNEDTIQQIVDTLSLVNHTLDKCLESPNLGEGEDATHSRTQFISQSVAVYLWFFRQRHIEHHILVPAVEETLAKLRDVKILLNTLGVKEPLPLSSDANSELDGTVDDVAAWFTSEWWSELFSSSGPHSGFIDGERWTNRPSQQLPDESAPPWPEPQISSMPTVSSHPPQGFASSAPNWQLQVIDPTGDIV